MIGSYAAYTLKYLLENKSDLVGLEIGCYDGDSAFGLLTDNPNIKELISVDPYLDYKDWDNQNLVSGMVSRYEVVKEKLSVFGDRHLLIREYSDYVVDCLVDNSLDFVFIDGLHTYEQVLKDCNSFYSKVKSGGIFAGHDFGHIEQVKLAVLDFMRNNNLEYKLTFNEFNLPFQYSTDIWYVIKG